MYLFSRKTFHMNHIYLIGILTLLNLSGCFQDTIIGKMTGDEERGKYYINLLQQGKIEQIAKDMDPKLKISETFISLNKMASEIPPHEPISIKIVGSRVYKGKDYCNLDITYECQFQDKWLLITVGMQRKAEAITILGFRLNSIPDSLENLNKFSLKGKNLFQYLVLSLSVIVPIFMLSSFVLCILSKRLKKKWLWLFFIILGVGRLTVNWTTGQWSISLLSIQLFGSCVSFQQYSPWMISVSLPLGAFLFIIMCRKNSCQRKRGQTRGTDKR